MGKNDQRPKILGLGYLGAYAPDLGSWQKFGESVLGLEVASTSTADTLRFKMDTRVHRLAVHQADHAGLAYVGWEVQDIPALERAAKAVEAAGVSVKEGDRALAAERSVAAIISFEDPSGTAVEIYSGARAEEARRFVSPLGVTFVTGDQGMGHITMVVDNYQETFDFYVRVLGFGVSDFLVAEEGLQAAFLGCNRRHHSVAFLDGRGAGTFLDHLMVEVDDLTDIGRSYDLVIDGGAPLSITLGKHWNDWMTSFYMESPSGFDLEYGWNGRTVDRATWPAVQGNGEISVWGHRAASKQAAAKLGRQTWIDVVDQMRNKGSV